MMQDIARIVTEPTAEDQQWFPAIAGTGDEMAVLRDIWANYRDESFILQFLSPKLIRHFGLFHVLDDANEQNLRVEAIHDERGYRKIQRALSRHYDVSYSTPDIQVVDVDLSGDRRLILHHTVLNRMLLEERDARLVLQHIADLWGYDVLLKEVDSATDSVLKEHAATARGGIVLQT
jgi:spore cortex formation protein SpoVR/YcgB (stage V sporulation)